MRNEATAIGDTIGDLLTMGGRIATVLSPPCFAGKALNAIRTLGVLRVGRAGDYKPFTFRDPDGTYNGADIVAWHRGHKPPPAKRQGISFEFSITQRGSRMES